MGPRNLLRVTSRSIVLVSLAAFAACGGGTTAPPTGTKSITISSGDAQTGTVGAALAQPLVALVKGTNGSPAAGETVTFAVKTGGGSLSATSAVTGADGKAQTTLTLGTTAGTASNTVEASVSGVTAKITFSASSTAGPAASAVIDTTTNNQRGAPGAALQTPIAAKVRDQYGNGVAGTTVAWAVTSGGGSIAPATSVSDANGRATATWTLGSTLGAQTATATITGVTGSPITVNATAVDVAITATSPDPLVEGQTATITGRGFDPVAANNIITVGGVSVNPTTATTTSLTFTVPSGSCKPAGGVQVTVSASGATSPAVSKNFRPASFFTLATGNLRLLTDPTAFCLQFDQSASNEAYLIGILNANNDGTGASVVSSTLTGEVGVPASPFLAPAANAKVTGTMASAYTAAFASQVPDTRNPAAARRAAHRAAEFQFRGVEYQTVRSLWQGRAFRTGAGGSSLSFATQPLGPGVNAVPTTGTTAAVGSVYPVKVINVGLTSNLCAATAYSTVQAKVRVIGTKGIWMEDTTNSIKLTDPQIQALSDRFDNQIYATDVGNWGAPSDLDNNGKVAILISRKVNEGSANVLGFVFSGDLFPATTGSSGCLSSNYGEIYYAKAPGTYQTPSGSDTYDVTAALNDAPLLIAHEFTHIIQNSRRLQANQNDMDDFEKEGGATLSEEINGWDADGFTPRSNLGIDVAYEGVATTAPIQWYIDRWSDMGRFWGFTCTTPGTAGAPGFGSLCQAGTKVANAPENCTFFAAGISPCGGGRDIYGNPATLLRWVVDQYGSTGAGDAALLSAMISSGETGLTNIANRAGIPVDSMLAMYYASQYTDDRPDITGLNPRLTFKSWNLYNIYYENSPTQGQPLPAASARRLTPRTDAFGNFSEAFSVRSVSSSFTIVSGARTSPVALRVRGADGTTQLPASMRVWVVRLR